MAGIQPLGAGELKFTKSVAVTSGQEIVGQGAETRITWMGGPDDPPLFEIRSFAGNGNAHDIKLRKFQVVCPNGGWVVKPNRKRSGDYYPVYSVERLLCEELVIRGGGIDLSLDEANELPDHNGEHYENEFNRVEFYEPQHAALRIDGFRNWVNGLRIVGSSKSTQALLRTRGHTSFGGGCRIEPWGDCPLAEFGGLKMKDGYVHRGEFDAPMGFHFEHHASRPVESVYQHSSDFAGVSFGGTPDWCWRLKDAALTLRKANASAVKGSGSLTVNGVTQQITEMQK